jgi:small subunit ribosomal protein S4e
LGTVWARFMGTTSCITARLAFSDVFGTHTKRKHRIRYPDPAVKVNDTVKIDLATGKISDFIKFDTGVIAMVTGGRNMGRVGVITHRERHDGGFNIVHVKDAVDNEFSTREANIL